MRFVLLICVTVLFCSTCIANDSDCSTAECINNGNTNLSTVILCNPCAAKALLNSDSSSRIFQQKLRKKQKNLSDVNVDVLLSIFEHLDIMDVLNLVKAKPAPTISAAFEQIFWKTYKDYPVHMSADFSRIKNIHFNNETKQIRIPLNKAVKLLRIIGSGIRDLVVSFPSANVSQCINKYAGDSLIKLKIENDENSFVYFKQPFEKLVELSFDYSQYNETIAEQLPLNQQFPQLRRLTLKTYQRIHSDINFCRFQHLEHLKLNNDYLTDNQTELFLRRNPQIRSLDIEILSQNVANIINRHLLNLENLTVSKITIENNTRFEHVKYLMVISRAEKIHKLSCPRLESLDMKYEQRVDFVQPWVKFFMNHQMLSNLTIRQSSGDYINPTLFLLTMNTESLSEINVNISDEYIWFDTISDLIEMHPKLERLNIWNGYFRQNTLDTIQQSFENDWNIVSSERNVCLERKK